MLIPVIHGILLCQLQYRESNFTAAGFFYSRVSQLQDYSNFENKIGNFVWGRQFLILVIYIMSASPFPS